MTLETTRSEAAEDRFSEAYVLAELGQADPADLTPDEQARLNGFVRRAAALASAESATRRLERQVAIAAGGPSLFILLLGGGLWLFVKNWNVLLGNGLRVFEVGSAASFVTLGAVGALAAPHRDRHWWAVYSWSAPVLAYYIVAGDATTRRGLKVLEAAVIVGYAALAWSAVRLSRWRLLRRQRREPIEYLMAQTVQFALAAWKPGQLNEALRLLATMATNFHRWWPATIRTEVPTFNRAAAKWAKKVAAVLRAQVADVATGAGGIDAVPHRLWRVLALIAVRRDLPDVDKAYSVSKGFGFRLMASRLALVVLANAGFALLALAVFNPSLYGKPAPDGQPTNLLAGHWPNDIRVWVGGAGAGISLAALRLLLPGLFSTRS